MASSERNLEGANVIARSEALGLTISEIKTDATGLFVDFKVSAKRDATLGRQTLLVSNADGVFPVAIQVSPAVPAPIATEYIIKTAETDKDITVTGTKLKDIQSIQAIDGSGQAVPAITFTETGGRDRRVVKVESDPRHGPRDREELQVTPHILIGTGTPSLGSPALRLRSKRNSTTGGPAITRSHGFAKDANGRRHTTAGVSTSPRARPSIKQRVDPQSDVGVLGPKEIVDVGDAPRVAVNLSRPFAWIDDPNKTDAEVEIILDLFADLARAVVFREDFHGEKRRRVEDWLFGLGPKVNTEVGNAKESGFDVDLRCSGKQ